MDIGKILRRAREELGIEQGEASKKFGISQGYLSDIERYNKMPKYDTMCKIANYYGIDIAKIWEVMNDRIPFESLSEDWEEEKVVGDVPT